MENIYDINIDKKIEKEKKYNESKNECDKTIKVVDKENKNPKKMLKKKEKLNVDIYNMKENNKEKYATIYTNEGDINIESNKNEEYNYEKTQYINIESLKDERYEKITKRESIDKLEDTINSSSSKTEWVENNENISETYTNLKGKEKNILNNSRLSKLKDILYNQLVKKRKLLDEKLRIKIYEKNKLEENVNNLGLELFRINKENDDLEKREKELINSIKNIKSDKTKKINENKKVNIEYNNEMMSLKKEINYYAEIYNKFNNNLLELNNLKKYYENIYDKTKVNENVILSQEGRDKIKEIKINKRENIINKMNHEINEIQTCINIKKDLQKNSETELKNLQVLINDEKREREIIQKNKNNIIKMLNDSINNMKKRDEIIDEIHKKLNMLKINVLELEKNNEQVKKENNVEKEKRENLLIELKILKKKIHKIEKNKKELNKCVEDISSFNDKIKIDIQNEQKKCENLNEKIKNINKNIQNNENKIKEMKNNINKEVDNIISMYTEKIKTSHFCSKTKNDIKNVKEDIIKKENEIVNYKNLIIRIKIQQILENTKIENMQNKRNKLNKEFTEKNNLLTQYEYVIKKNHYIIENKQTEVDRLNEELDKKMNKKNLDGNNFQGSGFNSTVPITLEIKIQKLNKEISEILKKSRMLEKDWFLKQSEMIKIQNENNQINEEILKGNDLYLILGQKKCELEENFNNLQNSVKKINKNIIHIRLQLERFECKNNDMLEKVNKINNDILKWNENANIKKEKYKNIQNKLKNDIFKLKNDKDKYQQNLLDYENQILIFENKIREKKKLQEIIKQYEENKDIIYLKKQIQHKNEFIENIKKKQNSILANIKLALNKRNDLDDKKELFQKNFENGVNVSFKIQHEISMIKKNIKTKKKKRQNLYTHFDQITQSYENLINQIQEQESCIQNLNQQYNIFDVVLKVLIFEKKHRFQELLKFQNAVKNVHTLQDTKNNYDIIKKNCSIYKNKIIAIKNNLKTFGAQNEVYEKILFVLFEWLEN
ncbi:conserved Plasmodium protein, unknown function [Plasmodium yoelii]|uniref:Uncharacterized protein n=4 Tax=Plasmodium yoelii TaxID=5861 RepID=A0AAF0B4T2_PLAYO|nr:conserved Plasmodium protein, unknown function [Plasmodium yoelii]WBY57569.1 hypothetical protein Py17XNL_000900426 [Plasmodium yoelii yoelii]VTZ78602.1 conserved Plasmodium protein, unknown function [Plasmodium yoelii]|eukprot:XP_723990.2 conserved Plasmodium protein, unknown function [Plasmodium yoelii]